MFSVVLKKHQRQLALTAVQAFNNTSSNGLTQRAFSAAPTDAEAAKAKEEWGEKYSDECFKFEKEWKQISDKIENEYSIHPLIINFNIGSESTQRQSLARCKRRRSRCLQINYWT